MAVSADEIKGGIAIGGGLLGFLAGIFGAGRKFQKFSGKLIEMQNRQTKLENDHIELATTLAKINDDIKKRLYREDGQLIYVQAVDCEKMQANCPARAGVNRIETKLDHLIDILLTKKERDVDHSH